MPVLHAAKLACRCVLVCMPAVQYPCTRMYCTRVACGMFASAACCINCGCAAASRGYQRILVLYLLSAFLAAACAHTSSLNSVPSCGCQLPSCGCQLLVGLCVLSKHGVTPKLESCRWIEWICCGVSNMQMPGHQMKPWLAPCNVACQLWQSMPRQRECCCHGCSIACRTVVTCRPW